MTKTEYKAVIEHIVSELKEHGYDSGYAYELGIGLGEFTIGLNDDGTAVFQFCSRFPDSIHFDAAWDSLEYKPVFLYGYVGGGKSEHSYDEWIERLRKELNK